jgi:hypothetical protein
MIEWLLTIVLALGTMFAFGMVFAAGYSAGLKCKDNEK